ncbi:RNA polymerase sigma-70 factor [Mucilaginibacter boryungensis]|uniref:RNA polymerase sigma-70 factor n=1 Tax=Mucilaginibacter boryungensis TaxID=768480 RepID=A0ABR9XHH2_9SPHI|nr:RNA polymerase sigma-70 factor [Mucilaginibacter boryungensis]MBE9666837.1 RNA polymerase sigma-70 factor [Mucilaginibacter boryungensis]
MQKFHLASEEELMIALQKGDAAAFTELHNKYWKTLLAIAYNHTKDKMVAEEIVQEIFISVWKRREVLNVKSLEAYLATAVRLSVFKQYKQKRRQTEIIEMISGPDIVWDEEKMYAKFLQEYINGVAATLPEKCQLVFKLSRVEGFTIPEIADQMNIAEKTVEAHLTKALKVIKLKLNHSGILLVIISKLLIK